MIRVMQEAALGQGERITEGTGNSTEKIYSSSFISISTALETALSTSGESPSPTLKSLPSIP
jgi:hypothetical protein